MQGTDKYNIVLIISDQHRRDAAGCYDNKTVRTPNIDKLAANGVKFTKAYCPSPLCAPSRASLITGKYPCNHKALHHKVNGTAPGMHNGKGIQGQDTIGYAFRKSGYVTGAIGKMHVHGETRKEDLGFDDRQLRFYTYEMQDYINAVGKENVDAYLGDVYRNRHYAYNTDNTPININEEYIFDNLVTKKSIEFLNKHKDENFFLHVGLEKPHAPWKTDKRFHDMYNPKNMVLPVTCHEQDKKGAFDFVPDFIKGNINFSKEEMQNSIAAYYANVTHVDENVGKIIDEIDKLRLTKKTVIIYTADHGESLFEHGLIEKHCFFEGAVGIPLIISAPGILPRGKSCEVLSSLVDLFPTCLELINKKMPDETDGISLIGAIQSKDKKDRIIYSEFHEHCPQRMILTRDWKYVYTHDLTEQLYDVNNDKLEINNLALNEDYKEICKQLKNQVLKNWYYD